MTDQQNSQFLRQQINIKLIKYNRKKKRARFVENDQHNSSSESIQSCFYYWIVKILQVILIVGLIILIIFLGYSIINEIKLFWFDYQDIHSPILEQKQASTTLLNHPPSNLKSLSRNLPVQKPPSQQQKNAQPNNYQEEIASQNMQSSVSNHQQKQANLMDEVQFNFKHSVSVISTPTWSQKMKAITPEKLKSSNLTQFPNYYFDRAESYQKSKLITILPDTITSIDDLADPVLKNIYKMHQSKRAYTQTIFITRPTGIDYGQYLRSKNLIQLLSHWDVKNKRIKVQQTKLAVNGSSQTQIESIQQKQKRLNLLIAQEKDYYFRKYADFQQISQKELPFCIVVPSFNNFENGNYLRNLNSIFMQEYDNFHVVYIDDNSPDDTAKAVQTYINDNQVGGKIKLIVNDQNKKALPNIFYAGHHECKQGQIMMVVDGDDYLIGRQVLKFLNFQYTTKKLLAAYTNYLRINSPYYIKVGTSTPYPAIMIEERSFRDFPNNFRASHLRTYYVDLFRKIKENDLKDDSGNFFSAANDFAIMMPILQMSANHFTYLPQITYLYDSGTGLNNFQSKKGMQYQNVNIVSKRPKYDPLTDEEILLIISQPPSLVSI